MGVRTSGLPSFQGEERHVLQEPPITPVPGAIPSTDNPLSLFGLWRATPRQSGPCWPPFAPARSTPDLWGFPSVLMAQPCTPHPTGFFRVLSKGRSQGQETQELTMQNIVILAGNIGQKPEVRAHPKRHQDHQLHPRHLAPPPFGRSRDPRRERLPGHGHRMAPHHLLQRSRQNRR